jgi:hypothetical protein
MSININSPLLNENIINIINYTSPYINIDYENINRNLYNEFEEYNFLPLINVKNYLNHDMTIQDNNQFNDYLTNECFTCPISLEIIKNPIMSCYTLPNNECIYHYFERANIIEILSRGCNINPLNRQIFVFCNIPEIYLKCLAKFRMQNNL